jgi:hypothetical protein
MVPDVRRLHENNKMNNGFRGYAGESGGQGQGQYQKIALLIGRIRLKINI